jgi:hypothetical protein
MQSIWLRPLNSLECHQLKGTEDANRHFWSPDSKFLAYFRGGKLFKIAVPAGSSQLICEAPGGADGSWGASGYILFDAWLGDTIKYVAASGGEPITVDNLDSEVGEIGSGWPWFLPDGTHFTYIANDSAKRTFKVGSIDSEDSRVVFAPDELASIESRIEFSPQGYFLYVRDDILYAHEFDVEQLKLVGQPRPIAQNIGRAGNTFSFGSSANGTLLYENRNGGDLTELAVFDREGRRQRTIGERALYQDVTLSPDNNYLAFGLIDPETGSEDIWIRDLTRSVVSRFTNDTADCVTPIWSHDGSKIAYAIKTGRNFNDWTTVIKDTRGDRAPRVVPVENSLSNAPLDWMNDDHSLIVDYLDKGWNIGVIDLSTGGAITPLIASQYNEYYGKISPDGGQLLFTSNESGRQEVYVQSIEDSRSRWQISSEGGDLPVWSQHGREIIYCNSDDQFVAVPISYEGGFSVQEPQVLFTRSVKVEGPYATRYAVTNDGQQLIINTSADTTTINTVTLIQNWTRILEE